MQSIFFLRYALLFLWLFVAAVYSEEEDEYTISEALKKAENILNMNREKNKKNASSSDGKLFLFHNSGIQNKKFKDKELTDLVQQILHESGKENITEDDVKKVLKKKGLGVVQSTDCARQLSSPYRTINGSCNNLDHQDWGTSFSTQRRLLPPAYEDGKTIPRSRGKNKKPLPNPRTISNTIHKNLAGLKTSQASMMLFQWGQFIDHDMGLTPLSTRPDGSIPNCCGSDRNNIDLCLPLDIPPGDDFFSNGTCLNFVRSAAAIKEDSESTDFRQQINRLTSFIDGSMVYGSSNEQLAQLRDGAFMKVSPGPNLPRGPDGTCTITHKGDFCFKAGDTRVHTEPSIASVHTLFVWEHNRIAKKLFEFLRRADNETIFQETRKIVIAEIQRITYDGFLPTFLPEQTLTKYKLRSLKAGYMRDGDYNRSSDPTINNDGLYSLRVGHTWIRNDQSLVGNDGVLHSFAVEDNFLNPHLIFSQNLKGAHGMIKWLASAKCPLTDRVVEAGARDKLFLTATGKSLDLVALNINRGRDHGLPPYGEYRKFCGLSSLTDKWNSLVDHTPEVRQLLENTFDNPADIDLFPGALSETSKDGLLIGPTFSCILGLQFQKLKYSDRYWYERRPPEGFKEDQLKAIRKVSLSSILCANTEGLKNVPVDSFMQESHGNPSVPCPDIPKLDLTPWTS